METHAQPTAGQRSIQRARAELEERQAEYERALSRCRCREPLPLRRYLLRWLCICGALIRAGDLVRCIVPPRDN